MKMYAKTIEECWRIAREEAEAYQRRMARARTVQELTLCRTARDAADRIALRIRFGRRRASK